MPNTTIRLPGLNGATSITVVSQGDGTYALKVDGLSPPPMGTTAIVKNDGTTAIVLNDGTTAIVTNS